MNDSGTVTNNPINNSDSAIQSTLKGSGGLMDKVSASQPLDRGFELQTIPNKALALVGSRKRTRESDLNKLWELA